MITNNLLTKQEVISHIYAIQKFNQDSDPHVLIEYLQNGLSQDSESYITNTHCEFSKLYYVLYVDGCNLDNVVPSYISNALRFKYYAKQEVEKMIEALIIIGCSCERIIELTCKIQDFSSLIYELYVKIVLK